MQPFLALITPLGNGGGVGQPPGIWGGGNVPMPTPPIYLPPAGGGGSPPGYWGGIAPPYPSHPIAPSGPPPGYWGGIAPPFPTHPIAPGGVPDPVPGWEIKTGWSSQTGWIVVAVPTDEHVTPSEAGPTT